MLLKINGIWKYFRSNPIFPTFTYCLPFISVGFIIHILIHNSLLIPEIFAISIMQNANSEFRLVAVIISEARFS